MKYILGGGITGLIFAFYNKDYKIITSEVGGQMGSSFNLGPRYLHDTEDSRHLLEELDIPVIKNTIRVGYLSDSGWIDEPDENFRQNYFKKSRGVNNLDGYDSSVLNSSKSEFKILMVNFPNMIEKLKNEIGDRIIIGNVEVVDPITQIITISNGAMKVRHYDKIISTIPLKIFNRVYLTSSNIPELDSYNMSYIQIPKNKLYDVKDFDYVYDSRMMVIPHRYTKEKETIILDVFGDFPEARIREMFDEVIDYKVLYNSQIISKIIDFSEFENIKFVGRYGSWNRKWKTEMVIKEARRNS